MTYSVKLFYIITCSVTYSHYRLKELASSMEKQHELLRLVVQKMEIHSEAEQRDVGDVISSEAPSKGGRQVGWSSSLLRAVVPRQAAIVNRWPGMSRKSTDE